MNNAKEKKAVSKLKILFLCLAFIIVLMSGIIYGIALHKHELYPYVQIREMYREARYKDKYGPWSIGIYEGKTPFELAPAPGVKNPVLTGQNCGDAIFVADPFMVRDKGKFYLFFERVERKDGRGDIAYAESDDAKNWKYKKVVIDEEFHLSYPNVFKWKNDYYMIPESRHDLSVRLYKAEAFPDKWVYVKNLLSGHNFVDSSILRYNEKWWLFTSNAECNILNIYYADDLLGEWKPHPMNPVVKFNYHIARPGGRVIIYNDRPYRFAQDDAPYYGVQLFAFEITELTEKTYAEKIVSEKPILTKSGSGWNAAGMHHLDPLKVGDKWIAVADGRDCKQD